MKKILIINGHPDEESFCFNLAQAYKNGADKSGADCKLIHLNSLKFNPILNFGYRKRTDLEPDLLAIQQQISESNHLVLVYPNWWGTYPAILKGFIDRVFLPDFAFKSKPNSLLTEKLLKGKSARLIVTMDSPLWYYRIFNKSPGHKSMKKGILSYCGFKPIKITSFGQLKSADNARRKKWINKVELIGQSQN